MKYGEKWPEYKRQWDSMKINPDREKAFLSFAKFAISHERIYQRIEAATVKKDVPLTGVPWAMIACIHWRESGGDFDTHLANGQPLSQRTTIAPVGLGPYTGSDAFFDGAVAALDHEGFREVIDWRLEKILYQLESYNGRGYEMRGLPSAYLWGGTNIQRPGKFGGYVGGVFVDNHFFPDVIDGQLGCAGMLATMMTIDLSIQFARETPMGVVEPPITPPGPIQGPLPPAAPLPPRTPTPTPVAVPAYVQAMLDRRVALAAEVKKLQAEDADLDAAIKIISHIK